MNLEPLSFVVKIIIICFSIVGLYYNTGLDKKRFKKVSLIYFTNLNLLFCLIYFVLSILLGNKQLLNDFIGFIIICVTVTMIVNHFILVPNNKKTSYSYKNFSFSDIVVHYLVPVITIAYWIIFMEKGHFEYYYPFIWTIPFLIYILIIIFRAHYGKLLEDSKTRYPYHFIDIDKLGVRKFGKNVLIVSLLIIILGYVFLLIDFLLK